MAEGGVEVTDRLVAVLSPDDDLYWFNLIGLDQFSLEWRNVKRTIRNRERMCENLGANDQRHYGGYFRHD